MENKYISCKQTKSNQGEKIIREVDYRAIEKVSRISKRRFDKYDSGDPTKSVNRKIVVTIRPRTPIIRTLYVAEQSRYTLQQNPGPFGSRLAIGDNSSLASHCSDDLSSDITFRYKKYADRRYKKNPNNNKPVDISSASTDNSDHTISSWMPTYTSKEEEQCSPYTGASDTTMTILNVENDNVFEEDIDSSEPRIANSKTENNSPSANALQDIYKKISYLEKKIIQQEMVVRSFNCNHNLSSSDEEMNKSEHKNRTGHGQPGCSYVEYSHIPETSAFQRHSHQPAPLSASKATTIQKEHNSEQYGRNFTLYDNITARGKRQCASVPCKRNDAPTLAAERVHKVRHKLNPVRDFRLMDTVHYLAQGEFAPRDDGIKLTPSREAVLSDIIWEDVCRTHWPNTRLARRGMHSDQCHTRSDLQKLIDNLLRERVAHIERRRRRHYRIVKLNHRHENCRPLGKTGDVIVASHKNKIADSCYSDHNSFVQDRDRAGARPRRSIKSNELLIITPRQKPRRRPSESSPGPSCVDHAPTCSNEPTCCYRSNAPNPNAQIKKRLDVKRETKPPTHDTSSSCVVYNRIRQRNPRLVIKKKSSCRRNNRPSEPNLEHFILLPTLVVRTPSNMRRQKKFNRLYHRILNVQMKNDIATNNASAFIQTSTANKKDVGFNINITPPKSKENLKKMP